MGETVAQVVRDDSDEGATSCGKALGGENPTARRHSTLVIGREEVPHACRPRDTSVNGELGCTE